MHSNECSQRPRVQVFIPVYNDIKYLPRAVNSVLMQRDVDFGLVISDNASTDGTYEYIRNLAAEDTRVSVHRNESNIGHIANMNRFADVVSSKYYMLLCSDDMLGSENALKQAVHVLDTMPDVVSVYSDMTYIDGADRKLAGRRFKRQGLFEAALTGQKSIRSLRNLFGIPLLHRFSACSDLRYPSAMSYVADVYFSLRAAERGKLYHIPQPLVWNRFSGQNLSRGLSALSRSQFMALSNELGIRLSAVDRLWLLLAAGSIDWRRRLFLTWARWRS